LRLVDRRANVRSVGDEDDMERDGGSGGTPVS